MPLEATVMIIDNSEYMRNGDYQPTRFDAQSDAVNVIFQTKTDSNPENTVGIMTSAGKCPEVLVTHTKDLGQILQGVHAASKKIGGTIDIPTSINIAQLALKHRENKNQRQRILVFVGSPLSDAPNSDLNSMVKLAKKLKKNNVAVDVVAFGDGIEEEGGSGEGEESTGVLRTFVENVNSGDNSHYIAVPPGTLLLSDAIITSPILAADRGALIPDELQVGGSGGGEGSGAGGGGGFEFGVDPSVDPELAMALRLSMQEAEARDRMNNPAAEAEGSSSSSAAAPSAEAAGQTETKPTTGDTPMEDYDEEEELRKALALSKGDGDVDMEDDEEDEDLDDEEDGEGEDEEEDEDEAIQRAIQMSMEGAEKDEDEDKDKKK